MREGAIAQFYQSARHWGEFAVDSIIEHKENPAA
jgi:hypothetical protein